MGKCHPVFRGQTQYHELYPYLTFGCENVTCGLQATSPARRHKIENGGGAGVEEAEEKPSYNAKGDWLTQLCESIPKDVQ